MKKRLLTVLVIIALIFVSACGNSNSGGSSDNSGNSASNNGGTGSSEGQDGETIGDDAIYEANAGMTIASPDSYKGNEDKVYLYHAGSEVEDGLFLMEFYLYPDNLDNLNDMSDEEFEKAEELSINVLNVFRVIENDWSKEDLAKLCEWLMGIEGDSIIELGKEGEYAIYYTMEKEYSENLPDELKPIYDGIISELDEAKDNIVYSKPLTPEEMNSGIVLDFTTTDFDGNTVSSKDLFAENKITMVNCWASWCGPCIAELPELDKLSKEFEEKGGAVVGLLIDGSNPDGLKDAKDIVSEAGVEYLNIIDWPELQDVLSIQFVPTTIFVDSTGTIVGETVIGAEIAKYSGIMNDLLGE